MTPPPSTPQGGPTPLVVDFAAVAWECPAPGLRVKALGRDGWRLRLVEFSAPFVEPDWCLKGHVGYVLEGEMDCGDEVVRLKAGDALRIPAGARHRHRATLRKTTLFLVEDA